MPLHRAIKLVNKALEEERKEYYYRLWLVRYPSYTQSNYESFDEFYEKCVPQRIEVDTRSTDEIMAEIIGKQPD